MAKEVLRHCFRAAGLTWEDSGSPPDTNGEMGLVEHFTRNHELRRQLSSWLATNTRTLRHCATLVARGTEIQIDSLVEFASDQLLPCVAGVTNQTDPTKGIATALAEAGYSQCTACQLWFGSLF